MLASATSCMAPQGNPVAYVRNKGGEVGLVRILLLHCLAVAAWTFHESGEGAQDVLLNAGFGWGGRSTGLSGKAACALARATDFMNHYPAQLWYAVHLSSCVFVFLICAIHPSGMHAPRM